MNANILYVCSADLQRSEFANNFMDLCERDSVRACMTKCDLGIANLKNKKKLGYNVLFVDYETVKVDVRRARCAIEEFVNNDPHKPVFILSGNYKDSLSATDAFKGFFHQLEYFERYQVADIQKRLKKLLI